MEASLIPQKLTPDSSLLLLAPPFFVFLSSNKLNIDPLDSFLYFLSFSDFLELSSKKSLKALLSNLNTICSSFSKAFGDSGYTSLLTLATFFMQFLGFIDISSLNPCKHSSDIPSPKWSTKALYSRTSITSTIGYLWFAFSLSSCSLICSPWPDLSTFGYLISPSSMH